MSLQQLAIFGALGYGVYLYATMNRMRGTPGDVLREIPGLIVPGITVDQAYVDSQTADILAGRYGWSEITQKPSGAQWF